MKPVIQIDHLYKQYHFGRIGYKSFRRDFQSWWCRIRGKDDPNEIIMEDSPGVPLLQHPSSFWALRDVNMEIKQGERIGIVGLNGAGKSTLLKILSRVTAPTKGEIRIRGQIAGLLEVGTGFHPDLTGLQNIFLNGAIYGLSRSEIKKRLDSIVDFAEIGKFLDTPVKRYSSGMYVRLAFAVAAHLEPDILLVDEVLAVGDIAFQEKCLGKMKDVSNKEGRTVVFVSHNLSSIEHLCPRSILLEDGQVAADGPTGEVLKKYSEIAL